ncbi:hypothetical protein H6G04_19760 [Calothrix membranacea FACHB-236]|nr:hypothetical protein [Calothrix membranacea FACHB-236]
MQFFLLELQQKAEKITVITEFIQTNPEARDCKFHEVLTNLMFRKMIVVPNQRRAIATLITD